MFPDVVGDDQTDEDIWEPLTDELDDDGLTEILFASGINWTAIAESFCTEGPGSRGPYGQIPRCAEFFACCLRAPDREFRHIFRYVAV